MYKVPKVIMTTSRRQKYCQQKYLMSPAGVITIISQRLSFPFLRVFLLNLILSELKQEKFLK